MPAQQDHNSLLERSLEILRTSFSTEQGWVKVHAAEALLNLGDRAVVYPRILDDSDSWEGSHKIGYWRVLANCAEPHERSDSLAKIEETFVDSEYPLRLTALESLCKLGFAAAGPALEKLRGMISGSSPEVPFAYWALELSGEAGMGEKVASLSASEEPSIRKLAAFVLRWMRCQEKGALKKLAQAAAAESCESVAYPFVLGATLALGAATEHSEALAGGVAEILRNGSNEGRYEVCQALQYYFRREDLWMLTPLLEHSDPDVRIGAAAAIGTLVREKLA